jgi:hypothetical protein
MLASIDVELSSGKGDPSRHRPRGTALAAPLAPNPPPLTRKGAKLTDRRAAPSVDAAELAMVPRGAATLYELEADALDGLPLDHRATLGGKLRRRLHAARD